MMSFGASLSSRILLTLLDVGTGIGTGTGGTTGHSTGSTTTSGVELGHDGVGDGLQL